MSDNPISSSASFNVEFNDPDDARRVNELMRDGLQFQQAVDQLELRPNEHFTVTRTDLGPDGRLT
ncbi:hypothetical protein A5784_35060 [Mycobacterium sp. 852013-50091_SCH5140682]|uniref:hypothetical protein n=1 Tax=Mycobacterium sp. 852013-50091_SCH5140682 TaxID=1834109 RepID=UPI0007E9A78F|nr:hypothetical protein [Mycobacterium sp. 852013-50091_SCH5140682]OBC11420.1 hypothetical protein A5784_35060 [Mycobacterium sp. 852013-50091_SCH5140682]